MLSLFRPSAKFLVSLGLVIFLLALLLLSFELKIVPDPKLQQLQARAELCETIAVSCSILANQGDMRANTSFLEVIAKRDPAIQSAGIRRFGDKLVVSTSDHESNWKQRGAFDHETHFEVPIFSGASTEEWGTVEVAFAPLSQTGWIAVLSHPWVRLLGFVGSLAFVIFYFYLGKMLKVMNAKSVPQRVRTALNTLAGGLIVADNRGDIVLANDALASWVGKSPESLMGKSVNKLPWTATNKGELPWDITFNSQVSQLGGTLRLMGADGERTLIVNSSPMVGHNGELRGVFIGLDDVTALEQKEVEHKKLREEAERANSAKSDFLARMSHEIRTPMNAILGFTDVLRRGFDESARDREDYLNTIHCSGEHLLALINDILDLSKVESGQMELEQTACSPHRIILDTLQVLQVRADEKSLLLTYEPAEGMPEHITSDPVRLRQIVTNLVGNAIKFTEKGSVQVVSRVVESSQGSMFEFSVVDTGIGIRSDALQRIFDPFSQADNSITRQFGGTGLGLAISKRFSEAMGGGISVQSELGKGTAFHVQIQAGNLDGVPRISKAEAMKATKLSAEVSLDAKLPACTVLIVDDGESNRQLLKLFLSRAGANLLMAENGQEAINAVNRSHVDVILMDMQMPVMDGYTAAKQLRGQGWTMPIIALTAHAMQSDEEDCISAGCSHFLPKPVNSNRLLSLMAEILGGTVSNAIPSAAAESNPQQTVVVDHQLPILSKLPMDDEEFREIVVDFVHRLESQLDAMDAAFDEGDFHQLSRLAHWLKGSGGTAGFDEFTIPAASLEKSARQLDGESSAVMIQGLRSITKRIVLPTANSI